MPANLTAQYHKAEEAYRRAGTPQEELEALQAMLREMPKHKGTDHLQAELKRKISKAKEEAAAAKKSSKKGHGVRIPRQGAGTVVLIGGPNSGKSQLLATLTRAEPEVADYPFTTREPQPGMMPWEDVYVQLVDTPPITADYMEPYMQGLIRGADMAVLLADLGGDDGPEQLAEVLDRLSATKTRLGRANELDDDDLGVSYTRTFLALNKMDVPGAEERLELLRELVELDFEAFKICAKDQATLEPLTDAIYRALDVVRVYTKLPAAKDPDYDKPFTLRRGQCVLDLAELVHRDMVDHFKFAKVWGSDVHPGTQVKGDHVLADKDVVELHA